MSKNVKSSEKNKKNTFPIVGIGASAGGLSAFLAFFNAMPPTSESGMAFVLVQHLAPNHSSMLVELIQRHTKMHVLQVEDGVEVQPNCVYIIPPAHDMALMNGILQLFEPGSPHGQRLPIDFFFNSLAQDQQNHAIGIILSGTGSDGSQGIKAIKEAGGMVIVQSPETAEYDGMPSIAIATGLNDYILSPAEMPKQLIGYTAHTFGNLTRQEFRTTSKPRNTLNKIFVLLRVQSGHDFSQYKPNTIQRRIQRRMAIHQIEQIDGYLTYLQRFPSEIEALFHDLLIGVTNFFRDPEVFTTLKTQVLPKLFNRKGLQNTIRIWSVGCSSGEEAYSLAILLKEYMTETSLHYTVQIFATDIDAQAIASARRGIYPTTISENISVKRLRQFFTIERNGQYRIHKSIRDMLIFSEQNIIKDPSFSKLDLISCRNLLIYLNLDVQKQIIPLFHYSLNPGGVLLLGSSESIGEFGDLFDVLDQKSKIYQSKRNLNIVLHENLINRAPSMTKTNPHHAIYEKNQPTEKLTFRALMEQLLLQKIGLSAALVDKQGDILYLHGRTGMYLELPPGEAGPINILNMAHEGIHKNLTMAFHKALKTKKSVYCPLLTISKNAQLFTINLTVQPIPSEAFSDENNPLYLIIFETLPESALKTITPLVNTSLKRTGDKSDDSMRIAALEKELYEQKVFLQISNHKLENSNEELKSFNEEMQSLNEEMQSTNEELETSKEELQSVNEELSTVNTELQTKVIDLSRANNDMNNLLAGTNIGTVFVDHKLHVMRFTPSITTIINFIHSDVGRPLRDIVSNLINYTNLVPDIQHVLNTLIPKEIEIQTLDRCWYAMSIQPYRTLENVIEGAVISFIDITEIIEMRNHLLEKTRELERLAIIVRDANDAITVQDLTGSIKAWNPAADRMYGWSETEALQLHLQDRIPQDHYSHEMSNIDKLINLETLPPYKSYRLTQSGLTVKVWITATALINAENKVYSIATTERLIP
ncbi:chemotaxis protein CheB [Thiomicrorhabdus arctica]|uniref:chemotaxis protein CheB n=1 Tax=Thiomicrorhabdus arctica TaxID=131540 RepID=UPI0003AA879C|nr:chemotaxis protein CheB [Thiomicrorhabdus arctica]